MKTDTFSARPTAQKGVVLVITLILLVIFSLLGTMAIRNANQSERVMNGIRTNAVAQQAAESALRFCEQVAKNHFEGNSSFQYTSSASDTYTITGKVETTAATDINTASWSNINNWKSSNTLLITLPANAYKSVDTGVKAGVKLKNPPTCLVQQLTAGGASGYLITGRGFANDAIIESSSNKVLSGAEVWLQSILTLGT